MVYDNQKKLGSLCHFIKELFFVFGGRALALSSLMSYRSGKGKGSALNKYLDSLQP